MIKTFIVGLVLGLLGTAALVYLVPVVDLHREASLIFVQPNLGNREAFHINLPHDRILAGGDSGEQSSVLPADLEWPQEAIFAGATTEIFKLRDANDVVVGIGARISNASDASGHFVQWMLHLPARGSMYAGMQLKLTDEGYRDGLVMAGTREFSGMMGTVQESLNTDVGDDVSARLELVASLHGIPEEEQ